MTPMTNLSPTDERATLTDERLKELLAACVKPLEWPDSPRRGQRVRSGHGLLGYTIAYYGGDSPTGPVIYRWAADEGSWSVPFQTYDQAKAAAQAHYDEAVASALNLDPILSEIKRMREVVEAASAFMPLAQVAFLWQTKGAQGDEVERYRDGYWRLKAALSTLSPQEPDNG
jgi:hypothetical protein